MTDITPGATVEALVNHGVRHSLAAFVTTMQRAVLAQTARGEVDTAMMGMLTAIVSNREDFAENILKMAMSELTAASKDDLLADEMELPDAGGKVGQGAGADAV